MTRLPDLLRVARRLLDISSSRPPSPERPARLKARLILSCLLFGFGLLCLRLYTLQVVQHGRWLELAEKQHVRFRVEQPERGRLLLRDGERLVPAAVSLQRGSLLIEGREDRDVEAFMAKLGKALGGLPAWEAAQVEFRLRAGRAFYLRRRMLEREHVDGLRRARLERTSIEIDAIRAYPFGGLGAQVLGLVDGDQRGATGIERSMQRRLRGTPGRREVVLDNLRRERVQLDGRVQRAKPGADVVLSLDRSLQAVAEAELKRLAQEQSPEGAAAVVVDVRTGDVLAMASWPSYDPSSLRGEMGRRLHNRAISYTYEPGSTLKPLFVGLVWQLGLGGPERSIHCPLRYKLPGRRKSIVDSHLVGWVEELQVLIQSSNTGAAKLASRLTPAQLRHVLSAFGLGRRSGIELPTEARGNTRTLRKLSATDLGSVAQGYALSVTPLQMALAYAALANGGTLFRPRLVVEVRERGGRVLEQVDPQAVARPLTAQVTRGALRKALIGVVNGKGGTARRARSKLYTIAGKTGTTKKLVNGRYHPREVVASFCGYAPAEEPRIAFSVVTWAPSTKKRRAWGGTAAAPYAGRIAERSLRLLRVPPNPDSSMKKTKATRTK